MTHGYTYPHRTLKNAPLYADSQIKTITPAKKRKNKISQILNLLVFYFEGQKECMFQAKAGLQTPEFSVDH